MSAVSVFGNAKSCLTFKDEMKCMARANCSSLISPVLLMSTSSLHVERAHKRYEVSD